MLSKLRKRPLGKTPVVRWSSLAATRKSAMSHVSNLGWAARCCRSCVKVSVYNFGGSCGWSARGKKRPSKSIGKATQLLKPVSRESLRASVFDQSKMIPLEYHMFRIASSVFFKGFQNFPIFSRLRRKLYPKKNRAFGAIFLLLQQYFVRVFPYFLPPNLLEIRNQLFRSHLERFARRRRKFLVVLNTKITFSFEIWHIFFPKLDKFG